VIVLDFDGAQGNKTLRTLGFSPHVKTGSGGHHVYIEHPGFRVATVSGETKRELARLYPGMDIRGDGGYAVFAGVNETGKYAWLRQPNPELFESLPFNLQALLRPIREKPADSPASETKPQLAPIGQAQAERLISRALERASTEGRNNAGFWIAVQLRDCPRRFKGASLLPV
jgi:hypothetical protein